MKSIKFFLQLLIVNCTLLIGTANAQWWVDGGNLIWPYGDVKVLNNFDVGGTISLNGPLRIYNDIFIDSLRLARYSLVEDGELSENGFTLNIPASFDNSANTVYKFDMTGLYLISNSSAFFAATKFSSTLGSISGNYITFNYSSRPSIRFNYQGNTYSVGIYTGSGSPEGSIAALTGSLYLRSDGGAGTSFYIKESGSGTTGWVAK